MKTNTIQVILTSVVVSGLALVAINKIAANFSLVAAGIGFAAVVILAGVTAVDYRAKSRNYAAR